MGARQHRLITTGQLEAAGLLPSGARSRSRRHQLFAVHPNVYALHRPPYSAEQRWLAAVLACGPGTLLSDYSAAVLLGLLESADGDAHVVTSGSRGRGLRGVRTHNRAVAPRDSIRHRGIPCTSATRTVVDLAATLAGAALEEVLLAADARRLLDRRRLDELIGERAGRRGTARLRELAGEQSVDTRSRTERRLLALCRWPGLPHPVANRRVAVAGRTFVPDLCWPELRLVVEADSWRWHGGRAKTERDRTRDQLLAAEGWETVRFTRIRSSGDRSRRLRGCARSSPREWRPREDSLPRGVELRRTGQPDAESASRSSKGDRMRPTGQGDSESASRAEWASARGRRRAPKVAAAGGWPGG